MEVTAASQEEVRFVDLFAGVGGFRAAFGQEFDLDCLFASEWDRYSQMTYEANWGEVPHGDITQFGPEDIPEHDILTAGFPCQPFSIAGVSKRNSLGYEHGFRHPTQGTLFFNVKEIIDWKRPRVFVLENVKNLLRHDRGRTFEVIMRTLTKELGYFVDESTWGVLDARTVVPQHRERVFIVGFRDREDYDAFKFPTLSGPDVPLRTILEDSVDDRYTLSDKLWAYLRAYSEKHRRAGNGFGYGLADLDGVTRTLSARYYKDGSEILVPQVGKNPRKLTPRECVRLMGYPESFKIVVSDSQIYKQMGNSVVVPVVRHLAEAVKDAFEHSGERVIDRPARYEQLELATA